VKPSAGVVMATGLLLMLAGAEFVLNLGLQRPSVLGNVLAVGAAFTGANGHTTFPGMLLICAGALLVTTGVLTRR